LLRATAASAWEEQLFWFRCTSPGKSAASCQGKAAGLGRFAALPRRFTEQLLGCAAAGSLGQSPIPRTIHRVSPGRQPGQPDPEPEQFTRSQAKKDPEQQSPRPIYPDKRESVGISPPSHRAHGVIWGLFRFFAITSYFNDIFGSWRYVLHPTLCHSRKLCKLFKDFLTAHNANILMHDMTFINK